MIKAIIFDADGMILNEGEIFSKRLSKDYSVPYDEIMLFFDNEFKDCIVGKADLKQEIEKYIPRWNWHKSTEDLIDYWFDGESQMDNRIISVIKELRTKGIHCYLATNQEKYRADYIVNKIGLQDVFDNLFISSKIGYRKPENEFFDYVMQHIGNVNKNEVLFWDDKPDFVEKAGNYGFHSEQYIDFKSFKRKILEYII